MHPPEAHAASMAAINAQVTVESWRGP